MDQVEIEKMREELAEPEICPCDFDVTIPGWLGRIEEWGEIGIYHKDRENFSPKRKITKSQFIDRINDETLNKMLGKWRTAKTGLTKCAFQCDYISLNGKHYTDKCIVNVKLPKELRYKKNVITDRRS